MIHFFWCMVQKRLVKTITVKYWWYERAWQKHCTLNIQHSSFNFVLSSLVLPSTTSKVIAGMLAKIISYILCQTYLLYLLRSQIGAIRPDLPYTLYDRRPWKILMLWDCLVPSRIGRLHSYWSLWPFLENSGDEIEHHSNPFKGDTEFLGCKNRLGKSGKRLRCLLWVPNDGVADCVSKPCWLWEEMNAFDWE